MSPAKEASAEIVIKRSRFIGTVAPAFSVEEAERFVGALGDKYRDADHNAFAFSVGQAPRAERVSDDGEPRGTAGYPILEVLKKRGLLNSVCVVTRYFGGILLGAGGLLRAYGKASTLACEAAGVDKYCFQRIVVVTLDYDQLGTIQREFKAWGIARGEVSYGEKVTTRIHVPPDRCEELFRRLADLTKGKAAAEVVGEGFFKVSR